MIFLPAQPGVKRRQTTQAGRYFAAVFETRLVENEHLVVAVPPVKVEVITGPAFMYRLSNNRAVVPLKGDIDEEVEIPSPPAIDFEWQAVERMIAIVGLLSSPTLFALPVYVGWASDSPETPINTTLMFSKPMTLLRSSLV